MFGWLRYLIYRQIGSLKHDKALSYKHRLSVVYSLASWSLFGILIYSIAKEKAPKINDSIDYAKLLDIKHSFSVTKYNNFKKVDEQKVDAESNDFYESSENHDIQNVN